MRKALLAGVWAATAIFVLGAAGVMAAAEADDAKPTDKAKQTSKAKKTDENKADEKNAKEGKQAVEDKNDKTEQTDEANESDDGWEVLFDGENLDAWEGNWSINEFGALVPLRGGSNLRTKKRYCDFVLELDYRIKVGSKANSGVFLRVHDPKHEIETGLEIQILDNSDYGAKFDTLGANGALYDLAAPTVDANKPEGDWNHMRIMANANWVTVVLNDKEIVKADLDQWTKPKENPDGKPNKFPYAIGALPQEGFIILQNYNGPTVQFRDIRLKPLSDRQPQYTGEEPIKQVLRTADKP